MKDDRRAFPRNTKWGMDGSIIQQGARGMSLRDWFAGQALPGLIALDSYADVKEIVSNAYQYADAMLRTGGK